jgi:CMP-N-acetylneuraminic acid synthetase
MKISALVPMKHRSERVPGKNFRDFAGQPLFYYIVESLLGCPLISEVVIDTDSLHIRRDIATDLPTVRILQRPPELCGDKVSMNNILLYDVSQSEADFYLQTHSTNPLLKSDTITKAINTFLENYPRYDSLFSVTKFQKRLWYEDGSPVNHDPAVLLCTQDLPPLYEENSCIYIFTGNNLKERKTRIGARPLMFEIDIEEAFDIDTMSDFTMAELLYLNNAR